MLVCLAGTAAAAPVATLREDVDGDTTADSVEPAADGTLTINAVRVKVAPAAAKARLLVAKLSTGAQLVVDVTHTTREGVVLDRKGGWHVVSRFPLGGVGPDPEYSVEVDATSAGVIRYQKVGRVQRCDDIPAYLVGEKLDGAAFKKLDRLPSGVAVGAATLSARLDSAPAAAPLVFQAKSASHQVGASDASALAIPRELDDGRLETQWKEDFASSGGEGQFFTFRARVEQQKAHQLRIVPGDPTSAVRSKQAGRPRVMAVVSKQGAWRFDVPPHSQGEPLGAAYVVELPATIGDCVTVVIESVSGPGPTAIAELGLYAEGERNGGGEAVLARVIAQGKGGESGAAQTLAKRGAAGAAAIDAELAKTTDAGARRRLIHALVRIVDPAATASLVRAATEGWVRDKDLIDVIGALSANGQIVVLRDLAAKGGLPVAIRVAAAGKLKPIGAGFTALVELAGKGPRELRREVIERLASGPIDQLLQAAPAANDASASGDLWRAATRGSRQQVAARPAVVGAMLAALPSTTDYERRYRLIDGIAAHGDAAALAALADALRALPADPQGAALRQVAVRGIASSPRSEAAPLVINFTRDTDPGVRLAALAALADPTSTASGPWHGPGGPDEIDRVIINAMVDRWPEVRRRAATALGSRCQRVGPAKVLFETVSKDKDLDVRGDAMLGLVSCKANGVEGLLPFVWNSAKHPLPLRERAIGLVVPLGDMKLATTLVGQFRRWRGQALESREAMALAQAAAATLGLMKPPGAADALIDALDDLAFPELVSAAALALGELGPACPARARAKLAALAKTDDQSAIAAKRAVSRCTGK
ncbi:MAG: hypothetical protein H0V17_25755 [Deltaproteobacteria bacterium]|nr:hypothetical protein [Deltaproteobacteria bacterium]